MINLALNGIEKGSSVMEIEAAVLRVMEKVNFQPKEIDTELTEAKAEGCLVMVFVAKELTGKDLLNLQSEFGEKFTLKILGKSKNEIFLQVEAPNAEFLNLGKRYVYQESRKEQPVSAGQQQASNTGQQPSRAQYGTSQSTIQHH